MSSGQTIIDTEGLSEDEAAIEASSAPLLEHLNELRSRLIKSVLSLIIGFIICLFLVKPIFAFLVYPYEQAVEKVGNSTGDLIYTQVLEFFFVKLKLALFGGVVLSFPVLAYQVYSFVAPGLYKNERGAFLPFVYRRIIARVFLRFSLCFGIWFEPTAKSWRTGRYYLAPESE